MRKNVSIPYCSFYRSSDCQNFCPWNSKMYSIQREELVILTRSFPLLLYHLLSSRTLPLWTIFFGVLSSILRRKRHNLAHCGESSPLNKGHFSCLCSKSACFTRRVPKPRHEKGVTYEKRTHSLLNLVAVCHCCVLIGLPLLPASIRRNHQIRGEDVL